MNDQQLKRVLNNLAEGLVPADADLWPAIRVSFDTDRQRSQKRKNPTQRIFPLNRRMIVAFASALAVILFAVFLTATPQGRAWAQEIIHFFTRAESDTQPLPTSTPLVWVQVTPGEPVPIPTFPPLAAFAADCGDYDRPACSVEEIRGKVEFPVMELGSIPEGMHFTGATGGPDGIALFYDDGSHTFGLFLLERPWTGDARPWRLEVGAGAVVETVQIGGVSGEYVKGWWLSSIPQVGPSTIPAPGAVDQVWRADAGVQTLLWTDKGVLFELQVYDLGRRLDKTGLIALAAGLTTRPVSGADTPSPATETPARVVTPFDGNPYNLSVAQAEALAGFDVLEPKQLPQIFFLVGASYQPEGNIVRIFYQEPTPVMIHTFGLRLSEQAVSPGADCELCGFATGNHQDYLSAKSGMVVDTNAVIETVRIGEFTGQYVEGMWMQIGSWVWQPNPEFMTLRWQANGVAFELYYQGFRINNEIPIDKADLIAIAESVME
jgi:hypothetical protein